MRKTRFKVLKMLQYNRFFKLKMQSALYDQCSAFSSIAKTNEN
jgi:hypothetical protein